MVDGLKNLDEGFVPPIFTDNDGLRPARPASRIVRPAGVDRVDPAPDRRGRLRRHLLGRDHGRRRPSARPRSTTGSSSPSLPTADGSTSRPTRGPATSTRSSSGPARSSTSETAMTDDDVEAWLATLGLPGIVDIHVHAMPDSIQEAVWRHFDGLSEPWPIAYRAPLDTRGHPRAPRSAEVHDPGLRPPPRCGRLAQRLHLDPRRARPPHRAHLHVLPRARGGRLRARARWSAAGRA